MSGFVRADISKLEKFMEDSEYVITEFSNIREKFIEINNELLAKWDGLGSAAYRLEVEHITEKIGSIKDILDTINNVVVSDLVTQYNSVDKELGDYNRSAGEE